MAARPSTMVPNFWIASVASAHRGLQAGPPIATRYFTGAECQQQRNAGGSAAATIENIASAPALLSAEMVWAMMAKHECYK
jgi:hypothetical protein